MTDETKEPRVEGAVQPSENPEGELAKHPEQRTKQPERSVSGDEAADAGRRATADEPVTRRDVIEQSAYKDDSADAGQRAAEAADESEQEE